VEQLRSEVRSTRQALERQTITAPAIDQSIARAEEQLGQLPSAPIVQRAAPREPQSWRLGDRARSVSGGWEGRITALERGGKRATLESGGIRVTVNTEDLEPAMGVASGAGASSDVPKQTVSAGSSSTSSLQLDRVRSVASSLDLRGARVDEALELLGQYLDDASLAGLDKVTIIHGHGTGALRDAVREAAGSHPLVKSFTAGDRGTGGDGATIVNL
jgi:DNA mismatch repair protein MutS2